ncbi:MAG: hypothetical protein LBR06_07355, partial [Bacteroidales bacterium]|nr:hypothetical protein [Bacteroidales bacterium]
DPRTLTNIPIAQNRLTTVIGHYFLPNAHLSIIVSDPFEDEITADYFVDDAINHLMRYSTVDAVLDAAVPDGSVFVPEEAFPVDSRRPDSTGHPRKAAIGRNMAVTKDEEH